MPVKKPTKRALNKAITDHITTHGNTSGKIKIKCIECGNLPHGDTDCYPDSQATAEQVKDWSRFKQQGEQSVMFYKNLGRVYTSTFGDNVIVRNIQTKLEDDSLIIEPVSKINFWKYAFFTVLLGLVAGMILATSPIINVLDQCK